MSASAGIIQSILDHAENRVHVLFGRYYDGSGAILIGVYDSKGQAERMRDIVLAANSPYKLSIVAIVRNIGTPVELSNAP